MWWIGEGAQLVDKLYLILRLIHAHTYTRIRIHTLTYKAREKENFVSKFHENLTNNFWVYKAQISKHSVRYL